MRDVLLCTWCGIEMARPEHEAGAWLCPDCEEGRQSDAVRFLEGPKEDTHDL